MLIRPWKLIHSTYLHPNIRLDECELPTGQIITPHIIEYNDEIMVFALTQDRQVVLIRQYRHGLRDVILELPGGSVDAGESPLEAARRELMEETGYAGETFIALGQVSPNPAIYTNQLHIFLAVDVESSGRQSVYDVDGVEVVLMPLEDVISKARSSELINSLNITTLFFVLDYLHRIS
jgi:8-oxo-dGTP pyrophosphatase MutT (NUDIX family)